MFRITKEGIRAKKEIFGRDKRLIQVQYLDSKGKLSSVGDKPARVVYTSYGDLFSCQWYEEDQLHRNGGEPAYVQFSKDRLVVEKYYNKGKCYLYREYKEDGVIVESKC